MLVTVVLLARFALIQRGQLPKIDDGQIDYMKVDFSIANRNRLQVPGEIKENLPPVLS